MSEKREDRHNHRRHRRHRKKKSKKEVSPHIRSKADKYETSRNEDFHQYMRESDDEHNKKMAKITNNSSGNSWTCKQLSKEEGTLLKQEIIHQFGPHWPAQPPSPANIDANFSPSRSCSESSKKKQSKKPQKELITSTSSPSIKDETFGTIRCDAGRGEDAGSITYSVTTDGRNYELTTNDGHHLYLEFSKKHAYLVCD